MLSLVETAGGLEGMPSGKSSTYRLLPPLWRLAYALALGRSVRAQSGQPAGRIIELDAESAYIRMGMSV